MGLGVRLDESSLSPDQRRRHFYSLVFCIFNQNLLDCLQTTDTKIMIFWIIGGIVLVWGAHRLTPIIIALMMIGEVDRYLSKRRRRPPLPPEAPVFTPNPTPSPDPDGGLFFTSWMVVVLPTDLNFFPALFFQPIIMLNDELIRRRLKYQLPC